MSGAPVYLDCAATTPVDPRVAQVYMEEMQRQGSGWEGVRRWTHNDAAMLWHERVQMMCLLDAGGIPNVYLTSGCTEANNRVCRFAGSTARHVISTQIEHPAVLEPLMELRRRGVEVEMLRPCAGGWVSAEQVRAALRPDTGFVSVMHVNNLTGIIQPVIEIAEVLEGHPAIFHVDGAQGFAKAPDRAWLHPRVNYYTTSAHKFHGLKGAGFIIERGMEGRRRGAGLWCDAPYNTLDGVAGARSCVEAVRLALREQEARRARCEAFGARLRAELGQVGAIWIGDDDRRLSSAACVRFEGLMADEVMLALEPFVAISSTSACSTASMKPSHVLQAMGVGEFEARGVVRLTWWHGVEPDDVDWTGVREALEDAL